MSWTNKWVLSYTAVYIKGTFKNHYEDAVTAIVYDDDTEILDNIASSLESKKLIKFCITNSSNWSIETELYLLI